MPVRRLVVPLALLALLVASGTGGYMLVEGWSFEDGLYQTVTTLSTVGFREIHDLSRAGRYFTMALILGGVGGFLYTLTTIVALTVEWEFGAYFGRRRMERRIAGMEGHQIICGFGRVGRELAREFQARGVPFVVVDHNPNVAESLQQLGYDRVAGNATDDETLITAGVRRAVGLLAAADADTDNTYIVLSARALNPSIYIVARASTPSTEEKMLRAGADRVISPYGIAGRHMAVAALQPAVFDFMTTTFHSREGDLILAEVTATPASGLVNRSLVGVFGDRRDVTVLALRRGDAELTPAPSQDEVLRAGDQVIVLGPPATLETLARPAP